MIALVLITGLVAGGSYGKEARVRYVSNALAAVANTDRETLDDTARYVQAMQRNKCRSAFHRLQIQCLLDRANRNCRSSKSRCLSLRSSGMAALMGLSNHPGATTHIPIPLVAALLASEVTKELIAPFDAA